MQFDNEFDIFIPITSLFIFMVGFSIGFECIPYLLMGELFSTEQRSFLSSTVGCINLLIMFFVIKTYHPLDYLLTTAGSFWIYSGMSITGVFLVIYCVPERKTRNLEMIAKLIEKPEKLKELAAMKNLGYNICYDYDIKTGKKLIRIFLYKL